MTSPLASLLEQAQRLHASGQSGAALEALDNWRRYEASSPRVYQAMAAIFMELGLDETAGKTLHEGLKRHRGDVLLSNQLANLFYRMNRAEEGRVLLAPFMQDGKAPLPLRLTYATLSKAAGDVRTARHFFDQVLKEDSGNVAALSNLAGLFADAGDFGKAIELYSRAQSIDPRNSHIGNHLARCQFLAGNLAEGWKNNAARFGFFENDPHATVRRRPFTQPVWKGERIAATDALLLWAEQGIGEEILFSSLLGDAQKRAPKVIAECSPRLVSLFARSFPEIRFVARADPPHPDLQDSRIIFQAPFGDLGGIFRASFSDFPQAHAHLKPDSERTKHFRAAYQTLLRERGLEGGDIIGFSWRSQALRHGDPKSTRLTDWAEMFGASKHLFVSLQHEPAPEDLDFASACGWNLHADPAADQARDLDGFAAQVAAMDRVITVSNTTAHMAGALGIKAAVLLPASRGLLGHWSGAGSSSPWYPSLTLLRQTQDSDWRPVIAHATAFAVNG